MSEYGVHFAALGNNQPVQASGQLGLNHLLFQFFAFAEILEQITGVGIGVDFCLGVYEPPNSLCH